MKALRFVPVVLAFALAAAGCAGRGEATDDQASGKDGEEAMLAFAECMREHGIDVPDPEIGGGGERRPGLRIVGPRNGGTKADRDKLDAAHDACEKHLEGVVQNITPEEREEMQDRMVRFAACMREHGIDMPDPEFSGDGHGFRQRLGDNGFDPDDPDFQKADEACRDEVFDGKGGGPGMIRFGGPARQSG
ncbi:MAG TPA: hypothetical protein VFA34_09150 [Actinomycetota bacterium]|jgi:hypothetical protein|nr:hypothetical protein [Actinomycetota bacterium]